jgi:hypothetical protein
LREKFPKLSDSKLKNSIYIGPQIREIINDYLFGHMLKKNEKYVWIIFKAVCIRFLGNVKLENHKERVENLLNAYQTVGGSMLLKIRFFTFPLGLLPSDAGGSER